MGGEKKKIKKNQKSDKQYLMTDIQEVEWYYCCLCIEKNHDIAETIFGNDGYIICNKKYCVFLDKNVFIQVFGYLCCC